MFILINFPTYSQHPIFFICNRTGEKNIPVSWIPSCIMLQNIKYTKQCINCLCIRSSELTYFHCPDFFAILKLLYILCYFNEGPLATRKLTVSWDVIAIYDYNTFIFLQQVTSESICLHRLSAKNMLLISSWSECVIGNIIGQGFSNSKA